MLDHRDSTRTQLRTQRNQIYGSSSMTATLPTIANSKMTIDAAAYPIHFDIPSSRHCIVVQFPTLIALLRYYSPSSGDYLHHHQQQLSVPFVAADSTAVVRPRTTTRSSLPSYVIDSRPRLGYLSESCRWFLSSGPATGSYRGRFIMLWGDDHFPSSYSSSIATTPGGGLFR